MKTIKEITRIISVKHIEKLDKNVLQFELDGQPSDVDFWLSPKQLSGLEQSFGCELAPGVVPSNKDVYAAFEQRGEYFNYIWSSDDKAWLATAFEVLAVNAGVTASTITEGGE